MSITTINQHLIHYEALGRGHPIIFIHGWLGSWRYWWPAMQGLSKYNRTFAFDLWGFGDSSKASEMYSFEAYVHMLDQFIDRLGIVQKVVLIGHSLGAAVALRFASQNSNKVERLVAVALPLQGQYIHERLTNSDSNSFIAKVLGKANSYPEVENETRKTDHMAMNRLALELQNCNFGEDLNSCTAPVLLLFGNEDPVITQPNAEFSYLQTPTDTRVCINLENCNHFPMLEQTPQFTRLILDFMHADGNLGELAPKEYWQRRVR